MKRKILLHVGLHKCGSTYLQAAMLRNRKALATAGVAYPHDRTESHPGNAAGIERAGVARLEALFGPHERLLLSHEDLITSGQRAAPFAEATRAMGVEVWIVAFIRPFSEYIFGDYSQQMKQNFRAFTATHQPYNGLSFERFAAERGRQVNPRGWLGNWQKVVPHAQLTLASHRAIRDTVEPFLNGAKVDWTVPRDMTNPSLRMQDCDALARMITDPASDEKSVLAAVRRALHETGKEDAGRTPERIAWIEAIFERQNAALMEVFGYDNRLKI